MNKLLYVTKKECPVCLQEFDVIKVRSRLNTIKQDTDFCTYYQEVNPYFYSVYVCDHCKYAAQDTYFDELSAQNADKIHRFLSERAINLNVAGERNQFQAIAAYRLALVCAETLKLPDSRFAALYLRLAWMYRIAGIQNEEQNFMKKAAEHFELAYSREILPIGKMSEITLAYLIGELSRRTEQYDKAARFLNEVIRNPKAKMEARVLDLARDAYQMTREAKALVAEIAAAQEKANADHKE